MRANVSLFKVTNFSQSNILELLKWPSGACAPLKQLLKANILAIKALFLAGLKGLTDMVEKQPRNKQKMTQIKSNDRETTKK